MPDDKPSKAPLIIFGTMVTMMVVSVSIVFITHSRRTEPYLDSKMRRVRQRVRPAVTTPAPPREAMTDAGPGDAAGLGPDASGALSNES